ncbi:hypothetical protein TorRG33x02_239430, partial [Trema orientale]
MSCPNQVGEFYWVCRSCCVNPQTEQVMLVLSISQLIVSRVMFGFDGFLQIRHEHDPWTRFATSRLSSSSSKITYFKQRLQSLGKKCRCFLFSFYVVILDKVCIY